MLPPASTPGPLVVVAAAIFDDGRLLAAQRSGPPALAGRWELPGGKVEPGEDDLNALIRECREELGITVELGLRVRGDWEVTGRRRQEAVLRVWRASIRSGVPAVGPDHRQLRWLAPGDELTVPWLEADLPILAALDMSASTRSAHAALSDPATGRPKSI